MTHSQEWDAGANDFLWTSVFFKPLDASCTSQPLHSKLYYRLFTISFLKCVTYLVIGEIQKILK